MPCGDKNECESMPVTTELTQNTNHEKHEHQKELCSPFCTCACCGISIYQSTIHFYSVEKKIEVNLEERNPFYAFIYAKDISSIIWQPPKCS